MTYRKTLVVGSAAVFASWTMGGAMVSTPGLKRFL